MSSFFGTVAVVAIGFFAFVFVGALLVRLIGQAVLILRELIRR
jgi:hypothetical protein